MNMGHNYTYRFFYKIGFYSLAVLCIAISFAWIGTSVSMDNSRSMELYWRGKYIKSELMLNVSIRENDILIDLLTAREPGVCEIYCENIREFKIRHAKRHNHDN